MKKMKTLLFLVILSLGISSCKKEIPTVTVNVLVEIERVENLGNTTAGVFEPISITLESYFNRDFYDINDVNVSTNPITFDSLEIGDVRQVFLKNLELLDRENVSSSTIESDVVAAEIDIAIIINANSSVKGNYWIKARRLDKLLISPAYSNISDGNYSNKNISIQ